ncbi:hypothetical protein ACMU_00535 [Actibacterium mucosum KCTC 23349]|uniref:RNA polymerase subunit sigma-24 n=1 Tax=Actibacterium mucosum KCTC 23349 TaxID=1454373 RepID=A0A037ZKQ4_9RHOB|nr:RNA polymerase sigma factor [Actibacterium mucosum]KAJ57011.1 hypothetical protein ACMU_00535 [Actibacterium mucosum KCTC 23349]
MRGSRFGRWNGPAACWLRRPEISTWLDAQFARCRPRAIAALTRQFRDIDLAEESFSDACLRAVTRWPQDGQPDDPFAWLLVTARRAGIDRLRKTRRAMAHVEAEMANEPEFTMPTADDLRDDVLRLLFICCHPALRRQDQLALALRVVVGMSVAEIARAFLVNPRTMEQRLTRAKRTVASNPVPFETPAPAERLKRLNDVSTMVYLLFSEGWSTSADTVQVKLPLCHEAIRLARLLLDLFPGMAEQMGLLALMLFQHARLDARTDPQGKLVPIDEQDRSKWDKVLINEARALLQKAARHGPPGAMQLQAAIAGVHAVAVSDSETDWVRLGDLYAALYALQPTPVVRLNQAAVLQKTDGPAAALAMLEPLVEPLSAYRWFHSMRGALLLETGDKPAARLAFERAMDLGPTAPEAQSLLEKIALCQK